MIFRNSCGLTQTGSLQKLLHDKEVADGGGVDAGAIKTANGFARVGIQRLPKKIERGIDEEGSRSALGELVQPENALRSRTPASRMAERVGRRGKA